MIVIFIIRGWKTMRKQPRDSRVSQVYYCRGTLFSCKRRPPRDQRVLQLIRKWQDDTGFLY